MLVVLLVLLAAVCARSTDTAYAQGMPFSPPLVAAAASSADSWKSGAILAASAYDAFTDFCRISSYWNDTPDVVTVPAQSVSVEPTPAAPPQTVVVDQPAPQTIIKYVTETAQPVVSGVTQASLSAQLAALETQLLARINALTTVSSGGSVAAPNSPETSSDIQSQLDALQREISQSQEIDNLANVTISNPTITSPSITGLSASDIPDLSSSYLSVAGGTLTDALINSSTASSSFAGALGIGTSSPSDLFALAGAAYLANIAAPPVTTNRLYANSGSLYWNGSLIGGGSVGNWTTDGTNVWRGRECRRGHLLAVHCLVDRRQRISHRLAHSGEYSLDKCNDYQLLCHERLDHQCNQPDPHCDGCGHLDPLGRSLPCIFRSCSHRLRRHHKQRQRHEFVRPRPQSDCRLLRYLGFLLVPRTGPTRNKVRRPRRTR